MRVRACVLHAYMQTYTHIYIYVCMSACMYVTHIYTILEKCQNNLYIQNIYIHTRIYMYINYFDTFQVSFCKSIHCRRKKPNFRFLMIHAFSLYAICLTMQSKMRSAMNHRRWVLKYRSWFFFLMLSRQ